MDGTVVDEQRIRTERHRFADVLGTRPRTRILIEASTESEWVATTLEPLGHEVVVADPNYTPTYATRTRRVKTDRRDARALAEANRLGAFRPAHRLTAGRRELRASLAVREALVRTRTRSLSLLRSLLRREGIAVGTGSAATFARRLDTLAIPVALEPRARTEGCPISRSVSLTPHPRTKKNTKRKPLTSGGRFTEGRISGEVCQWICPGFVDR